MLPKRISFCTPLLTAVLLYFANSTHAITILAPAQDVYVLVTLRNDTSFAEFKEMVTFYLDIQSNCPNCTPPITNFPCLMYFGEVQENFTQLSNVTSTVMDMLNTDYAMDMLYPHSISKVSEDICTDKCIEIEFFLSFISVAITRSMNSPDTKLRKKKIAIVTNYFYPSVVGHLNGTQIEGYNLTYINYFVPNDHILNRTIIEAWPYPVEIFSCSSSDAKTASQLYMNQFIDFTPDSTLVPITGFIDIGYSNLMSSFVFFDDVFNQGLCKYSNDLQYYEIQIIVHYSGFHVETNISVPYVGNFTSHYFSIVTPYLVTRLFQNVGASQPVPDKTEQFIQKIGTADTSCDDSFYDALVTRIELNSNINDTPLFTFFVSDAMPSCFVEALNAKSVLIGSYMNHVEIILHISDGASDLSPSNVYQEVTSVIFDKNNVSQKGNHVYVTDISKPGSTDLLGICANKVAPVYATKAKYISKNVAKKFKWEIIGGCVAAVALIVAIIITVYVKRVKIRRWRQAFLQRHKQNSTTHSRHTTFRFVSDLANAVKIATELGIEENSTFRLWRISPDSLKVDANNVLGRGSSATIYSGFLTDMSPLARIHPTLETTRYEACAVAVKTSLSFNNNNDEALANELTTLLKLQWHTNICAFLGWSVAQDKQCLVFEKADSDLLKYAQSFRDKDVPPIKNVASILWQLSNAMVYLASLKLVHRDLAARNVFLTSDSTVKLGDFGLCCECNQTDTYTASITKRLPIKWLSPEAILDRLFSEASDVWSFGVIIFEVYSGGIVPYGTMSNEEMVDFVRTGNRLTPPKGIPKELEEIMLSCWHEAVIERPTFEDLRSVLNGLLEEITQHYGYLSQNQFVR